MDPKERPVGGPGHDPASEPAKGAPPCTGAGRSGQGRRGPRAGRGRSVGVQATPRAGGEGRGPERDEQRGGGRAGDGPGRGAGGGRARAGRGTGRGRAGDGRGTGRRVAAADVAPPGSPTWRRLLRRRAPRLPGPLSYRGSTPAPTPVPNPLRFYADAPSAPSAPSRPRTPPAPPGRPRLGTDRARPRGPVPAPPPRRTCTSAGTRTTSPRRAGGASVHSGPALPFQARPRAAGAAGPTPGAGRGSGGGAGETQVGAGTGARVLRGLGLPRPAPPASGRVSKRGAPGPALPTRHARRPQGRAPGLEAPAAPAATALPSPAPAPQSPLRRRQRQCRSRGVAAQGPDWRPPSAASRPAAEAQRLDNSEERRPARNTRRQGRRESGDRGAGGTTAQRARGNYGWLAARQALVTGLRRRGGRSGEGHAPFATRPGHPWKDGGWGPGSRGGGRLAPEDGGRSGRLRAPSAAPAPGVPSGRVSRTHGTAPTLGWAPRCVGRGRRLS